MESRANNQRGYHLSNVEHPLARKFIPPPDPVWRHGLEETRCNALYSLQGGGGTWGLLRYTRLRTRLDCLRWASSHSATAEGDLPCVRGAARPDPNGPPGSRFYPSWPQLQFCSYTQIHLGPLRAALLEYGQKCLAASFRFTSFSDLSRLIIAASPILTTETTRSSSFVCFPVVLCHHYGCDHGFHYHFKPCLLF